MRKLPQFTMLLAVAALAGAATPPPAAPVRPVADDYFGAKVNDNYRYFEDLKKPKVQKGPTQGLAPWTRCKTLSPSTRTG